MKRIFLSLLVGVTLVVSGLSVVHADTFDARRDAKAGVNREGYLDAFTSGFGSFFFQTSSTGEAGAKGLLVVLARDVKNVFMLVAIIYLVIGVLKILFSQGGDDDVKHWRMSILWTTVGIVVMQIAFAFVNVLYNKDVNGATAFDFLKNIVYPFVHLLEMLAAFLFLAMAFYAFYRIITAGGDEEGIKKGKQTIFMAIAGYLLLKIPGVLVASIYGEVKECAQKIFGICQTTLTDPNLPRTTKIMTTFVNYANGFIALVTVLLIIYAGWLVLSSGGDDDKLKKAKSTLVYIFIGLFLLVASYVLFNFFVLKG